MSCPVALAGSGNRLVGTRSHGNLIEVNLRPVVADEYMRDSPASPAAALRVNVQPHAVRGLGKTIAATRQDAESVHATPKSIKPASLTGRDF